MFLGFGHLRSEILLLRLCLLNFSLAFTCLFEFLGLSKLLFLSFKSCHLLGIMLNLWALFLCLKVQLTKSFKNEFSSSLYLLLFKIDILLLILNFVLFVSNLFLFFICLINLPSCISQISLHFFKLAKFLLVIFLCFCKFNLKCFKIFSVLVKRSKGQFCVSYPRRNSIKLPLRLVDLSSVTHSGLFYLPLVDLFL